jgi:hypothetical protein
MSLPKRSGSLQLLAYLCPALVLWTHAGSANVKHMIPIFLALSYELACTRRSLALGDNGLILNTMRVAEKTYPSILSQMENADAALETVKQNLKLKKKAEFARKKAIRNPCTVPDCKKRRLTRTATARQTGARITAETAKNSTAFARAERLSRATTSPTRYPLPTAPAARKKTW